MILIIRVKKFTITPQSTCMEFDNDSDIGIACFGCFSIKNLIIHVL